MKIIYTMYERRVIGHRPWVDFVDSRQFNSFGDLSGRQAVNMYRGKYVTDDRDDSSLDDAIRFVGGDK